MPSYRSIHRLAKEEDYIVEGYGHTQIDMGQKKYTALCGYVGFSNLGFTTKQGVTCLRCKKKMQANKACTRRAEVGAQKVSSKSKGSVKPARG